jgi:hypothetical protein
MFTPAVILLLSAVSVVPVFAMLAIQSIRDYCHHRRSCK